MGILYEKSVLAYLVLTVAFGGGCAWMAGRALARGWRPFWRVIAYMALFGLAIRFFHYALAQETLLSPRYYAVDTLFLMVMASLGYRVTRASQMASQYGWLYRRTSPFTWAPRGGSVGQGT